MTTNNENILMMFEEINQKLDRSIQQIEKMGQKQPEVSDDNNENLELKSAIENLYENQSQRLRAIENAIRTEKRKIEFTPTSTFGMAFFFSLMLIVLGLSIWIYSLKSEMGTLVDNDLKCRYVFMRGEISPNELNQLENIFENRRDSVFLLRKQVIKHEKALREQTRLLNEARLKEMEAERLKREAEKIEANN